MIIRTEKFFKEAIDPPGILAQIEGAKSTKFREVRRRIWWLFLVIPVYIEYEERR